MSHASQFFFMGGYAAYVWPAYIVSALSLLALSFASWLSMRRFERMLTLIAANETTRSLAIKPESDLTQQNGQPEAI
jgi:heme exporter protein D